MALIYLSSFTLDPYYSRIQRSHSDEDGNGNGGGAAAAPVVVVELHDFDVKNGRFPPPETWGDYDGVGLHTSPIPLRLFCFALLCFSS